MTTTSARAPRHVRDGSHRCPSPETSWLSQARSSTTTGPAPPAEPLHARARLRPCVGPGDARVRWDPVRNTAFYMLYLAEDAELHPACRADMRSRPPRTRCRRRRGTTWSGAWGQRRRTARDRRPTTGSSGRAAGPFRGARSALGQRAQHTFTKKSPPVTGRAPRKPRTSEVTFTWDNYWHDPASADPADKLGARPARPCPSRRCSTASRWPRTPPSPATMSSIGSRWTRRPTRRSPRPTPTAPTGGASRRIDDFGNAPDLVATRAPRSAGGENATFTVSSAAVALDVPSATPRAGTVAFTWQAQPYAKGYDIEVYKNDDITYSAATESPSSEFTNGQSGGVLTTAWTWNKVLPPSASAYLWRVRQGRRLRQPRAVVGTPDASSSTGPSLSITSPLDGRHPASGRSCPCDGPRFRAPALHGRPPAVSPADRHHRRGNRVGTACASEEGVHHRQLPVERHREGRRRQRAGHGQVTFTVDSRLVAVARRR